MKAFTLFILFLGITFRSSAFEMGINAAQTAPIVTIYYNKQGPQIRKSGTLYLLGQHIAKHTKEPTTFNVVNRADINAKLISAELQSLCYITPQWLDTPKGSVFFSKPFMSNNERFISRKPIPLIKQISDLYNLNIGIVKGYNFPSIKKYMDSDFFTVEYQTTEVNAFISLFREDELDAIIFKEKGFKYFMQTMPSIAGKNAVTIHPLSLGELKVSCALSAKNQHYLPIINKAIDEFVEDHPL